VGPDGGDPLICLEAFAQAAGALFGYRAWLAGIPFEGGALVGVRKLELRESRLPVGVSLRIHARERWTIDAMSHVDCALFRGEAQIAEAQLVVAVGRFEEYVE